MPSEAPLLVLPLAGLAILFAYKLFPALFIRYAEWKYSWLLQNWPTLHASATDGWHIQRDLEGVAGWVQAVPSGAQLASRNPHGSAAL